MLRIDTKELHEKMALFVTENVLTEKTS